MNKAFTKTKKKLQAAAQWAPVQEFATSKDPNKYWHVDRDPKAAPGHEYRCDCPGFVFRWPNETRGVCKHHHPTTGEPICKHVLYVIQHENDVEIVETPEQRIENFATGMRRAFLRRVWQANKPHRPFDETRAVLQWTLDHAATMGEAGWNLFVDDVRLLAATTIAPAPKKAGLANGNALLVGLGKRRILLDGD